MSSETDVPAKGDRVMYEGSLRTVAGRLRYPEPPIPGTITGRTAFLERCVVLATIDGVTLLAIAIAEDFERADARLAESGPLSPDEAAALR